jgi:hypothetical protein
VKHFRDVSDRLMQMVAPAVLAGGRPMRKASASLAVWLPEGVRAMRPEEGLHALPEFGIPLLKA